MYINIHTQKYPCTIDTIRQEFKNISFPNPTPEEFLHSLGYMPVQYSPIPEVDFFHTVQEVLPEFDIERNVFLQKWELVPISRTPEEIDEEIRRVKNDFMDRLSEKKIAIRDGGFPVTMEDGSIVKFDSDYQARTAYMELVFKFMLDPTYTVQWKASNNEHGYGIWILMTYPLFMKMQTEGTKYIGECFVWVAEMEQKIKDAITLEQLQQIEDECVYCKDKMI